MYIELRPEEWHAYEVFEASRGCHLYFDLDGRSAGSMPCEDAAWVASSAAGVLCEHISRFIIPEQISRLSLQFEVSGG